jgi:glycolate oxidase
MSIVLTFHDELRAIVGDSCFIADTERLYNYAKGITSADEIMPAAVIIPNTAEQVAAIVTVCNKNKIPLTVRGGGTGVSGGALSYTKGIIISMERLNKVIGINKIDRTVTVEAGMITQELQEVLEKEGLYFPQNISSAASCFIGGNVAVSSGSPKSLKYGPTKNYVLNLEVVLPDGRLIWTGKNVNKNATGYNLTQLFAGSEGTLGIITKVVLQLVSRPQEMLVLIPFSNIHKLFECVHQFFIKGFSPSSIEFIDKEGYEIVSKFLGTSFFKNKVEGLLWIELEGKNEEYLLKEMEDVCEFLSEFTEEDVLIAQTKEEIKRLWAMRTRVGEAIINVTFFRDIDLVVPCSKTLLMYTAIAKIAEAYNFKYSAFGHIGNGNFHVNVFQTDAISQQQWEKIMNEGIPKIFAVAVELGGTISGEHGIGKIQKPYVNLGIPKTQMEYMLKIKRVFDPNGILNPGILLNTK